MHEETDKDDPDMKRLKEAARLLGEHFDVVAIYASRHEANTEGGTVYLSYGVGNWFARYGQVRDWIVREEERAREKGRRDQDE